MRRRSTSASPVLKIIKQLMIKDMTAAEIAAACEISPNCSAEWVGKLHVAELIKPVGFGAGKNRGTKPIIWSWNYVK